MVNTALTQFGFVNRNRQDDGSNSIPAERINSPKIKDITHKNIVTLVIREEAFKASL